MAVAGLCVGCYVAIRLPSMVDIIYVERSEGLIVGAALALVAGEAIRRVVGLAMLILILAFLAYGLFGHLMPGAFETIETPFTTFVLYQLFGDEGLLGRPLIIVSQLVFVFIVFGQVFKVSGGGAFVTDLAFALVGKYRGGPAKVAILSSGFFGSVSGSVMSNVLSTGTITIPLMRRLGFSAPAAGGIEAVASTGGQLVPPVMGAAAFLLAEFVGVNYSTVAIAAIVPAVLFYFILLVHADQLAAHLDLTSEEPAAETAYSRLLWGAPLLLIPFGAIVIALVYWSRTPAWAGVAGIFAAIAVGALSGYRGQKVDWRSGLAAFVEAGLIGARIAMVAAGAGLIIGVINLTGVGYSIGVMIAPWAGDQIFLVLLVTFVAAIVLGLGLPTTAVYILVASLLAPPLIQAGIDPLAAHLFVFYGGMLSMITPPVAFAALAASSVSGAGFLETSMASLRFGWAAYILPFLFVFAPELLLRGAVWDIAATIVLTGTGLWLIAGAVSGLLRGPLSWPMRAGLAVAGAILVYPGLEGAVLFGAKLALLAGALCWLAVDAKRGRFLTRS